MNREYENVFTNSMQLLSPSTVHSVHSTCQVDGSLQDLEVSVDGIVKVLTDLKTPPAPGPDTVNSEVPQLSQNADRMCRYSLSSIAYNLYWFNFIWMPAYRLEESKHHPNIQEGLLNRSNELQVSKFDFIGEQSFGETYERD